MSRGLDLSLERAALQQFVRDFISAWNRHDADAMASAFAPNGELLNTRGRLAVGRAAVQRLLSEEHATSMRASSAQMGLTRLRYLTATTVHADAQMTVAGVRAPDGRALPPVQMHVTFVARKLPEGWRYLVVRPYTFVSGF